MGNISGYIAAFHHDASRLVGITYNEMLDRFGARVKPKIHE